MQKATATKLTTEAKTHKNLNSVELLRRRMAKRWSRQQLAVKLTAELGRYTLSQQYIAQLEQGGNPDIPVEMAAALERILS